MFDEEVCEESFEEEVCEKLFEEEEVCAYPSTPSVIMSAPLCSAAMALASGIPTRSRKHRPGSARIDVYFS